MKNKRKLTPEGVRIKKKLVDKRMSQKELAEQIGCSRQYLTDIMYGMRSGKKYLPQIYEILDLKRVA